MADDHAVIRKSVRRILESHTRFEVCGKARDSPEAVDKALRLKPDVVVLNITMPVLGDIAVARELIRGVAGIGDCDSFIACG